MCKMVKKVKHTHTHKKRIHTLENIETVVGEKMDKAEWYGTNAEETPCCQQMLGNSVARLWRRKND